MRLRKSRISGHMTKKCFAHCKKNKYMLKQTSRASAQKWKQNGIFKYIFFHFVHTA